MCAVAGISCGKSNQGAAPAPSAASSSLLPVSSAATANPSVPPTPDPAPTRTPPAPPVPPLDLDAGGSACRLLRATYVDPSFIAPVLLRIDDRDAAPVAQLIFNDLGTPHFVSLTADEPRGAPVDPVDASAPQQGRTKSTLPSCVASADTLFCPDASGDVHAWRGEHESIVAHARTGTDLAAEAVGEHVALAYLAERTTSEGVVREAWMVLDGGAPVRISEDGSGATFVELARRGSGILAMTIDARVAMTPAHARFVGVDGGKISLGPDAVVFVGGSAERHNAGALATAKDGSAFELVAVADGASAFGMAAIHVEDPPREDEPVVWSLYPNGLDPAPIAATHGSAAMFVARVRPRGPEPKSSRVLEIGELSREGVFAPRCIIAEAPFIKDVELEQDQKGGLWVFYRDPRGSVLERRGLPGRR